MAAGGVERMENPGTQLQPWGVKPAVVRAPDIPHGEGRRIVTLKVHLIINHF